MAKQYTKHNKNKTKCFQYNILKYLFFILGIIFSIVFLLQKTYPISIACLVVGICMYIIYHRKSRILASGLEGEKKAREYLSHLPNDYLVLNNIPLEKDGRRTELDSVVVSKFGIYIVEVKNHGGIISGDKDAAMWTQTKHGDKQEMKNPLKQLRFQTFLLKDILKDHGIDIYVDGCILFTRASEVHVNSDQIYLSEEELLASIESDQIKDLNIVDIHKVKSILKKM